MTGSLDKSFEGTLKPTLIAISHVILCLKAKFYCDFNIGAPRSAKLDRSVDREVFY